MSADLTCKIILIGNTSVGKTCILRRFTDDQFSNSMIATIGMDFRTKFMELRGKVVKAQIWDTAGQEKYQSMTLQYYRGSKGVLIVYDITDRRSFNNVSDWIYCFKQMAGSDVIPMLIGNKCDLEHERIVQKKEGEKLAKANSMLFSEVSAKNNINIDDAFSNLFDKVVAKEIKRLETGKNEVDARLIVDGLSASAKIGGCCVEILASTL